MRRKNCATWATSSEIVERMETFRRSYCALHFSLPFPIEQRSRRAETVVMNPNGIPASSPGLRGTSYPGKWFASFTTPTGLRLIGSKMPQPRWGCDPLRPLPRVARSSQPWAGGHNPVGIEAANLLRLKSNHSKSSGSARTPLHLFGGHVFLRHSSDLPSNSRAAYRLANSLIDSGGSSPRIPAILLQKW